MALGDQNFQFRHWGFRFKGWGLAESGLGVYVGP